MTQTMYPRKGKGMSEAQWQNIGRAIGDGIIDDGGWPYGLTSRDSVNNTITLGVDSGTGFAAAFLSGFMHHMDAPEPIPIPAVSTDTTYEVGLAYDPLAHETEDGPLKLTAWTLPANYDSGKVYLTFYRIVRRPNVSLADSQVIEYRPRLSSGVRVVTNTSGLPHTETTPTDTLIVVRSTNDWYRLANNGTDPASWVKITPQFPQDVLDDVRNATHLNEPGELVRRWAGTGTFHVPTPEAAGDVASKGYVDGKNWDTSDITSGVFNRGRIDGSTHAYNATWTGGSIPAMYCAPDGRFITKFSTERLKDNIEEWAPAPRGLLAPVPSEYNVIDPDTGETLPVRNVGVVAEQAGETVPEFVIHGPEEAGGTDNVVKGWDYAQWTTAHQVLHRWNAGRVDATVEAVKRIAEQTGVDISDLIPTMEG